jgi:hypothetical protein
MSEIGDFERSLHEVAIRSHEVGIRLKADINAMEDRMKEIIAEMDKLKAELRSSMVISDKLEPGDLLHLMGEDFECLDYVYLGSGKAYRASHGSVVDISQSRIKWHTAASCTG